MMMIEKRKKFHAYRGHWPACKNKTDFMCGRERLPKWWSVSSLAAKITPWHQLKLQWLLFLESQALTASAFSTAQ